ncbi:MAG: hypothetical protein H6581_10575 [Bacteroidia bacterium]|nr:hypothetical protein [Bacteroidia bacterium]
MNSMVSGQCSQFFWSNAPTFNSNFSVATGTGKSWQCDPPIPAETDPPIPGKVIQGFPAK